MAHYKETEIDQGMFLTINLSEQLIPGTYEYTLTRLIDNKLDLSIFDRKYNNDYTGAAAIEPRLLLKIKGINPYFVRPHSTMTRTAEWRCLNPFLSANGPKGRMQKQASARLSLVLQ